MLYSFLKGVILMNERIRQIRKDYKLTQTAFGQRIGLKGNTITNYENGLRTPNDSVILAICREYSVSERWLRTGQGEPYVQKTQNEEIALFMGDLLTGSDAFKARLISALSKLSQEEWATLERIFTDAAQK
jgi:transcriptional regulator with XRE-family HTH domain